MDVLLESLVQRVELHRTAVNWLDTVGMNITERISGSRYILGNVKPVFRTQFSGLINLIG